MKRCGWIVALAAANLRSEATRPGNAALLAAFMALNNLMWFAIWWLFFGLAGNLRGWTLRDAAELYAVTAIAYGIYAAFFGGARNVAPFAIDGILDVYLGRPRSPLVAVLLSRSDPTGFGDIVSGIGLMAWAAGDLRDVALALGLALLGASVIVSAYVAIGSLAFFTTARARFFDQLFDCFLTLATMPQIGLPAFAKVLLYTAVPAAFVGFVPVEILRGAGVSEVAGACAAAVLCPAAAAALFRIGLRRYASGNRLLEPR